MEKMMFEPSQERLDDLQLNNLMIYQNPNHYCFTTDAVLLANFAKARTGETIVDFCSGSGVIGILLSAKTKEKKIYLVELQEYLSQMSMRSVEYNKLNDKVIVLNESVQNVTKVIEKGSVDVVVCNPPYKMENSSLLSETKEIAICKHEIAITLAEIIENAAKLLRFGGYFYTINKEERLTDIMVNLRQNKLEPKELVVIPSKKGSSLVMIKAKKGGKSGIRVHVMP